MGRVFMLRKYTYMSMGWGWVQISLAISPSYVIIPQKMTSHADMMSITDCSIGQNLQPMHSYFNSEHLFCKDCWHILVMFKLKRIWNIPIKTWNYNIFSAFFNDGYCVIDTKCTCIIYITLPASVCFSDNSDKKSNK